MLGLLFVLKCAVVVKRGEERSGAAERERKQWQHK
jgi:hypothetical protein